MTDHTPVPDRRVVWWYPLNEPIPAIRMPLPAEILTVRMREGQPVVYALVDPDMPATRTHRFACVNTGDEFVPPTNVSEFRYLSTFQDGPIVWHAFYCGIEQ